MKKIILTGIAALFVIGFTSCGGGGHNCDAYNSSNYTKYKAEQSKTVDLNIRKK